MRIKKKRRASILITALIIFLFISTILLVIYTYSSNNFKQAKIQEENMRAHFLARSACELARAALVNESILTPPPPGGVMPPSKTKWEVFVEKFSATPPDTAFMNLHSVCISHDGSITEPGYASVTGYLDSSYISDMKPEVVELLRDSLMLIKVTRVSDTPADPDEKQYKGFLRVEAIGRTGLNGGFKGESKCYLYIDCKNQNKMYWR